MTANSDQHSQHEGAVLNSGEHKRVGDVVVLDVGGTRIRIGHLRNQEPCTDFNVLETSILRVDNAYDVLSGIIRRYTVEHKLDLFAVVIGLPGMLDQEADTIAHCNNIRQMEGHGLQSRLISRLQCKVVLEQDIMLQLLGEWKSGAAKASPSVFGVYYGTGIGAAYLVDGDPKVHSAAGLQAGHIPIMAQGKPCICGNTDCVEAYACGHTLLGLAQDHDCPVERLFLVKDDKELQNQLDTFIQYQAYLIATLVTLFVPDMILVGGGIPQMNGYPHDKLIAHVQAHLQKPYPAQTTRIAWASLGNTSVLHGASALLEAP